MYRKLACMNVLGVKHALSVTLLKARLLIFVSPLDNDIERQRQYGTRGMLRVLSRTTDAVVPRRSQRVNRCAVAVTCEEAPRVLIVDRRERRARGFGQGLKRGRPGPV